jgi:hypothetical protein
VDSLSVYPNPVVDGRMEIEISLNKEAEVSFELYDQSGNKTIICENKYMSAGTNVMDHTLGSGLTSGTYFLKMDIEGRVRVFSLSIIR